MPFRYRYILKELVLKIVNFATFEGCSIVCEAIQCASKPTSKVRSAVVPERLKMRWEYLGKEL